MYEATLNYYMKLKASLNTKALILLSILHLRESEFTNHFLTTYSSLKQIVCRLSMNNTLSSLSVKMSS